MSNYDEAYTLAFNVIVHRSYLIFFQLLSLFGLNTTHGPLTKLYTTKKICFYMCISFLGNLINWLYFFTIFLFGSLPSPYLEEKPIILQHIRFPNANHHNIFDLQELRPIYAFMRRVTKQLNSM